MHCQHCGRVAFTIFTRGCRSAEACRETSSCGAPSTPRPQLNHGSPQRFSIWFARWQEASAGGGAVLEPYSCDFLAQRGFARTRTQMGGALRVFDGGNSGLAPRSEEHTSELQS